MSYLQASCSSRLTRQVLVAAGVLISAAGQSAAPLPTGGVVESGSASITHSVNTLSIQQNTARLQMGWDSFNIGSGQTVNFSQPSSSSLAVNMVRGSDASVITGNLTANGRVVLINPQGIAFTPGSQVNVGSLVASALRESQGDFSNGRTTLSGAGGDVSQAGVITIAQGGSAVLAGARVTNTGHILADAGKVALAGGSQVSLDYSGDGLIKLNVDAGDLNAAVKNGGAIRVGSGHILLTSKAAGTLANSVVRNTGDLQASTLVERGGEIWLTSDVVESSGTVAATSQAGQGGEAHLVGRTSVSVTGTVDVTGGTKGGFVDVSAPAVLLPDLFQISVGRGGLFLLDPENIIIAAAGSSIVGSPTDSSLLTDITLSKVSIQNWLAGGASLILDATGNITVQSSISVTAPGAGGLTLDADGDINVQASISTTGSLTLLAGNDIDITAPIVSSTFSLSALNDVTIDDNLRTTAGNLNLVVGGDLYLDNLGGILTFQSFGSGDIDLTGRLLTNIPLLFGGTDFEFYSNAGATLDSVGWIIAEDTLGPSLFGLAGDVHMQYGFKSGFNLPTATDLAFVADGQIKYPDLYANQSGVVTGLVRGDALVDVFSAPNLAFNWTAGAPTGTSAAGSTFAYSLTLGAGSSVNRPGYVLVASQNAGTLTVRPRELLVKPRNFDGTYGSALIPTRYPYELSGFQFADTNATLGITGEAITTSLYNPANPLQRGAGDYAITITTGTLAKSGPASANYQFNLVDGNYAIAKAPLNIQAENKERVYGEDNPNFTYIVVNSDLRYSETAGSVFTGTPNLSTTANALTGVGFYDIVTNVGTLVNNSPNYDIVLSDATLTITKAPLIVTADDKSREYGLPNTSVIFSYTYSGFVNGDNALIAGITGTAATSTTALITSPIGDYNINISGGNLLAANYDFIQFEPGTLTVTRAPLTVTAQDATREYGLPNNEVTLTYVLTGLRNSDTASVVTGLPTLSTAATQLSDAGTYTINVGPGTLTAANYTIGFLASGLLTITPATSLVITANNQQRFYGDINPSLTSQYTITGFRNGDTLISSGINGLAAVAYDPAVSATSNVGRYNIFISRGTLVDAVSTNYNLPGSNYVQGFLTINKAPVSLVADSKSKIYGDANPALTYTLSGLKNGETRADLFTARTLIGSPVLATSATPQSTVGSYDITVGLGTLSAVNYEFTPLTKGTLTVDKRALTVTARAQTREYVSADQFVLGSEASYAITGFFFSQTAADLRLSGDLSGSPTMTTNAVLGSNVGTNYSVNIAKGSLDATNYSFDTSSFVGASYTITKAPLTVTASDKTRFYGDTNPSLEYTFSGFKLGEATLVDIGATGLPTISTAVTPLTNVGLYPVVISVSGMSSQNYSFVEDNGVLTIAKAPLTLKVDDASSEYGSDFSGFVLTMTGFKNDQNQAGLRSAVALSPTGRLSGDAVYTYTNGQVKLLDVAGSPYTVGVTGLGTLTATNYDFVIQVPPLGTGQLTVTPAPLTLKTTDITRTYGEASTQLELDVAWDIVGLKNNQTRDSLVTSGAVSGAPIVSSAQALDILTNAGTFSDAITATNGTFGVSPTGNYTFSGLVIPAAADLIIDKAVLTVGVLDTPLSKIYGASLPSLTPTYTGFKNSQTSSTAGLNGSPVLTHTASQSSNVGSYAVTVNVSGLSANNYTFTPSNGSLTITKAPLTVSANPRSREYGLNNSLTASLTGFVLSQTFGTSGITGSASLTTTALPTSNIGDYPITTALGTLASNNYDFVAFNDSVLTITRAPLTITAESKFKTYGDLNPALTYVVNGLRQADTATVISGGLPVLSTTVSQLSGAGTYSGVILADISALSADNYTIGTAAGTFTIQKATLTGTVDSLTRLYGYPNPQFTVTWAGYKNSDTATNSGFAGNLVFATVANPASPVAGSPYTVSANVGNYSSPNYSFGSINSGLLTVDRGNLWENEVYNLAAAPLAGALRLEEIQSRYRGRPLNQDPQEMIDFDKYSIRLSITPAAPAPKKEEANKPAANSVSQK